VFENQALTLYIRQYAFVLVPRFYRTFGQSQANPSTSYCSTQSDNETLEDVINE